MSQLTIYKASAGSGKTYRITGEYLKLLFENPENYRHILGVTFTNKATAEMKSRIISELYKLSKGETSGYATDLVRNKTVKQENLKDVAAFILYRILHDYSHFTISTIDSFFQRVVRTFAREIGLMQGFEIEMDQKKVLLASIDQMIFRIDDHPELKEWLIRFAKDKIVDGQSWNFVNDIEALGNELFKENYKEFSGRLQDKISDKTFLTGFEKKLNDAISKIEGRIKALLVEGNSLIQKSALITDDFKGKSRGLGDFFSRNVNKPITDEFKISDTIRKCFDNIDGWIVPKSDKKSEIEALYQQGLNRILGELLQVVDTDFIVYRSISKVKKNFYVLGLIADLQTQINEYTSDKNLFLISDTAELLYKLIDGSDAPFIYERTGSFIHHYMIDEFQDTSVLQWKNFKPLLTNSLAEGNQNWVVGDVKQSIYRWRNSDWTILAGKIGGDVAPHNITVETLNYNWRSSLNIVKFNNTFFRNAIDCLSAGEGDIMAGTTENEFSEVLHEAYSGFEQLVPDSKLAESGYIRVEAVSLDSKRDKNWKSEVLGKLSIYVEKLQDSGYSLSDIAILVRDKKDAQLVSDHFLSYQKSAGSDKYKYDIISGDSLLVKNAEIVKWLIAAIKYIESPSDSENTAFFVYQYDQFIAETGNSNPGNLLIPGKGPVLSSELTAFFMQSGFRQRMVYELIDEIIIHFNLTKHRSELPFLQAFQDLVYTYYKREPGDIHSFLQWWDEHSDNQVISMPASQNAMRLMTFHSSKGLEFPAVLIPFGDWEIVKTSKNSNFLWCQSSMSPLDEMELLPVNMSKSLEDTVFIHDYLREKALLYVDNINLLYVAFTRAIDVLCVFVPDNGEDSVKNSTSSLIINSLKKQDFSIENVDFPALQIPDFYQIENAVFEYGEFPVNKQTESVQNDLNMNRNEYPVRVISDVTKQVITSFDYFQEGAGNLTSRLNLGTIMHELFQNIKTPADIDHALLKLNIEGKITRDDMHQLKQLLVEAMDDPKAKEWFTAEWEIKNEASILLPDGTLHRPDRVMIRNKKATVVDYKFGDEEKPSYQSQVARYMRYLRQMGYTDIEGYLWYVSQKKIVPVVVGVEQGKLF